MTFQIDLMQALGLAATILGGYWFLAKLLVVQAQKHIDKQFEVITKTLAAQTSNTLHIERELMALKAELPREYVRREDNTRVIATVQVSIDNLRLTLERLMMERTKQ